jgi:glycosyltransferase involved in cell wall biosynthesis
MIHPGTPLAPQLSRPQVSCIMPTADRRAFIPGAIAQFLRQDYQNAELLILDDGVDPIGDLVPQLDRIRHVREARKRNVGQKRNYLCELARGDVILHWDDDDWAAPWRVRYQVEQLLQSRADVCGLDRVFFYEPAADQGWEYTYPKSAAPWVYGATLCYTRAFWRRNPFAPVSIGEDSRFVWSNEHKRLVALSDQRFFVGLVHSGNTSVKRTRGSRWQPYPAASLRALMSADHERRSPAA